MSPASASLFSTNARRIMRQPASWRIASAASGVAPGRASAVMSFITHPWSKDRVGDVSDQVAEHGRHGHKHGDAERHRVIAVHGGVEVREPDPGEVEQLLDDQPERQNARYRYPDQRGDRDRRVG